MTHQAGTDADSSGVTISPNLNLSKSGLFQATNTLSGTGTATLKGRIDSNHQYHTVKTLTCAGANSTDAALVTLFPEMQVTTAETSGSMSITVSIHV